MRSLTSEHVSDLVHEKGECLVSLYASMQPEGSEVRQNQFRWKNILKEAHKQLDESGVDPSSIQEMMRPAEVVVDDRYFWQHQSDGLAFFLSDEGSVWFHVPFPVEQRVVVADNWFIRPLLPAFRILGKACFSGEKDRNSPVASSPSGLVPRQLPNLETIRRLCNQVESINDDIRVIPACNDPGEIYKAARLGLVENLWIDEGFTCFGHQDDSGIIAIVFDSENRLANIDIVNQILIETLHHEGSVVSFPAGQLPVDIGIFATFRTPLEKTSGNLRQVSRAFQPKS